MISGFIFLMILSMPLVILYIIKMQNRKLYIEKIKENIFRFNRKNKENDYIRLISIAPDDRQKIIFGDFLMLAVILSVMYLFISKSIFFATVVSDSMNPTFSKNDIILLQNIDRRYNVGDIITFKRPDTSILITHRIVNIDEEGFIRTAGDATRQTDWWQLKNDDITGKAILIQRSPIIIKDIGMYFIAENKNQRYGPYDYKTLFLVFEVLKLYGYIIAIISIFAYIILENNRVRKIKDTEKMRKYRLD